MGFLIMKNILKYYEFAEETKFSKGFTAICEYIFLPIFPLILYCFVKIIIIKNFFGANFISPVINRIIIIAALLLGVAWLIIYKKSLKGIFLYDNYLQISTGFFLKYYIFTINPKVRYSDIKSISVENKKNQRYKEWNEKHLYFIAGYYSNIETYIKLETINDRIYCFSLENQEEFVDEIKKRISA